mgnify:FL=1
MTVPSLRIRAAAALELRRRARAKETATFNGWLKATTPEWEWDWPHLRYSQARCDQVTRGELTQLIELMPPRHGKTEQGTIRYPAYRLEMDPSLRIIVAAYNQTIAEKFSRKIRRLVRARGVPISSERNTAADWETEDGGGVRAVGVGAGVAGQGADLIIVDDPIKNRLEAESLTYRERLWDWFTSDLWTRREPGAAVVIRVTPWHHDDLVGRIKGHPEMGAGWTVVRLPAEAEENDPLGREFGAALCPDRYPLEELRKIAVVLGPYAYSGLYQCRPTPRSGNMFPRDKVPIVPAVPVGIRRRVRGWDKAGTKDAGKRSSGVKLALGADGITYVEHVVLGQWAAAERNAVMDQTAAADGPGCPIVVEQEPGSGGKESAQITVNRLQGYTVKAKPATGDKATRADPFAAQWQAGNVRLVKGEWNQQYLDEMELAPSGAFVDQMDASALAYNELALHQPWGSVRVPVG